MNKDKKYFSFLEVLIVVIVTGIVCGLTTGIIILNSTRINGFAYADLTNNSALNELLEVYASVITDYYEEIDEYELANSAIAGMMNFLGDDYSNYLNQAGTEELQEKLTGEYEGIGIRIVGGTVIEKVFEDTPAYEAGIKENDQIVKIDGVFVTGKTSDEIVKLIKGSESNIINLVIKRGEEELEISVERKKINLPSVEYEIISRENKNIGYIFIETFSSTTASQFKSALTKLEKTGIDSLIIDVRDNSGGYLTATKSIANLFIEKGRIIYSLEDKAGIIPYYSETKDKRSYKIAVLINNRSASASEILAAALSESYGAKLVGEKSFGKGKVQQTMDLETGGMVKYTSARWLTPNGDCIDGFGINPDHEVKVDKNRQPAEDATDEAWMEYYEYLLSVHSAQLEKAIEVLLK